MFFCVFFLCLKYVHFFIYIMIDNLKANIISNNNDIMSPAGINYIKYEFCRSLPFFFVVGVYHGKASLS